MNIYEALTARRSVRAYTDKPVEREKLLRILEAAARTPSWGNSQPWEVYVASGAALNNIRDGFEAARAAKTKVATDIPRPAEWTGAAKARMQALNPAIEAMCGEAGKDFGRLNKEFFLANTVVYIVMDKLLGAWSMYDIGAWTQSFMLAAVEEGLATIPAIQLAIYPDVIRRELSIPDNKLVTLGIAVGYEDKAHGINNLITARDPISDTVKFFD
jgi:nitroreductase